MARSRAEHRAGRAAAAALLFSIVWTAELVTLPALDVSVPPVARWDAEEVAIDALHDVVYAGTTSAAFDRLSGLGPR